MKNYIFNLISLIIFVVICFTTQLIYAQNNNKGKWVLIKTNVFLPKPTNDKSWEITVTGGSGSFNYKDKCKVYSGKYNSSGTFSYSTPPATLTPGVKTEITASVNVTFVIPEGERWWNPGMDGILWESPLGKDTSKMYFTFSYKKLLTLYANQNKTSASGKAELIPPEANGYTYYKIRADSHGGGVAEYIYEWKPNTNNENENITNNENINENENIVNNENENINNNENENTQNQGVIINLYSQSPSTIYISPGDKNTCTLQADVSCANSSDKKGRTINIEVLNGQKGTFNSTTASTDANGNAYFTYTAPDESALNGQKEIKVDVKATDVKSGEFSVIPITIMSRNSSSSFSAAQLIMPQGKEFYNELTIFINAPSKGDGYQATLTTKEALGLITSSKTDPGGESPVFTKIKPGKEYKLFYHHTGSSTLSSPIEDEITLEIPELNIKKIINVSVGMDLAINTIERRWKGPVYPGMPEPLEIEIVDYFHPTANLEYIFKDFDIKMRVRILPAKVSGMGWTSGDDIFSSLVNWSECTAMGDNIVSTSGDAIVTINKFSNGKYILCQKERDFLPYVFMFDRGSFEFRAELIDIDFPENLNNNSGNISFTVVAYRDEIDEWTKTFALPLIKKYFDLRFGTAMTIIDLSAIAGDFLYDYKSAIEKGKLQDALVLVVAAKCNQLGNAKGYYNSAKNEIVPLTDNMKRLLNMNQLASYSLDLVKEFMKIGEMRKGGKGGGLSLIRKIVSNEFEFPQLLLKGMKNYYFIMMEKKGLNNYSGTLKNGNKLLPITDKLVNSKSAEERIVSDNDYVVIAFENSEDINLSLDFNGSSGFLYRVTKDKIDKIEYPKSSSNVKVNITNTNTLTFGKEETKKETKSNLFSGSWETTDFGSVSFVISGNNVVGACTKNLSGMKGILSSDGTKITGTWAKFPTYSSPNDAGKFEVTISSDGKSFTGKWGKGTDSGSKLTNNLNGKKK